MSPEHAQARELVENMGEITQELALWIISILGGEHEIKHATLTREQVEDHYDTKYTEAQWAEFSSTYEWRNLDEYFYDGAYGGLDFARGESNGSW